MINYQSNDPIRCGSYVFHMNMSFSLEGKVLSIAEQLPKDPICSEKIGGTP